MSIINNICEHGHLERKCEVCELKAEIARLRSVCRVAADCVVHAMGHATPGTYPWQMMDLVVRDLADAGKEPSESNPIAAAAVREASDATH